MAVDLTGKIQPKNDAFTGLMDEDQLIRGAVTTVSGATHTVVLADLKLDVTRTATGTCVITIDSDNLVDGREFIITDAAGGANTYNITINTEGAETIVGEVSAVINGNYHSLHFYSDGSNYFLK